MNHNSDIWAETREAEAAFRRVYGDAPISGINPAVYEDFLPWHDEEWFSNMVKSLIDDDRIKSVQND